MGETQTHNGEFGHAEVDIDDDGRFHAIAYDTNGNQMARDYSDYYASEALEGLASKLAQIEVATGA